MNSSIGTILQLALGLLLSIQARVPTTTATATTITTVPPTATAGKVLGTSISSSDNIQGYKIKVGGTWPPTEDPPINEVVTLDGGTTATADPYFFYGVTPGQHTVSVNPPAGWTVSYSTCTNAYSGSTCQWNVPGNTATVTMPQGDNNFVYLTWNYNPPTTTGATSGAGASSAASAPTVPANQTATCSNNQANLSWSSVGGSNYTLWYYDATTGEGNGVCGDGVTCANLLAYPTYQFTTTPGDTYKWAVFSYNGQYSSGPTWNTFTCGSATGTAAALAATGATTANSSASPAQGPVTISPASAVVAPGGTVVFTATMNATPGAAVGNWFLAGRPIPGGNSAGKGTLQVTGPNTAIYTAPAQGSVSVSGPVSIAAASAANPGQEGGAIVQVGTASCGGITGVTVTPSGATAQLLQQEQFTATVAGSGNYDSSVSWYVDGVQGNGVAPGMLIGTGNEVGTIDSSGLYQAPDNIPNSNPVVVTAISNQCPSQSASASVNIEDTARGDITITDFHLTDASGNPKTTFAVGEPIYPSVTEQNVSNNAIGVDYGFYYTGFFSNATTSFAAGQPAGSDVNVWVDDNLPSIAPGSTLTFAVNSPTGSWTSTPYYYGKELIAQTNYWVMNQPGTYTALAYADSFNHLLESNLSNNQVMIQYTVTGTAAVGAASSGCAASTCINTNPSSLNLPTYTPAQQAAAAAAQAAENAALAAAAAASSSASKTSTAGSVLTSVQGYNQVTGAITNGVIQPNQYMILNGTFAAGADHTVLVNGQDLPPSAITSQGTTQIKVLLSGLPSNLLPTSGSISVSEIDQNGTSNSVTASIGAVTGNPSGITFPVIVDVTATSLNVRSAPNTSAGLAGSQTLYAGNEFTAINEIQGEDVDGNDLWWVSSAGNYVWSGGTELAGGSAGGGTGAGGSAAPGAAAQPRDVISGAASNAPTVQQISIGGNQYAVTYSYLGDGEVSATFAFNYPDKNSQTNNPKTSFPLAAQGVHQYIYQGGVAGILQTGGSVLGLIAANDCNNFYGPAGCIEFDPDFTALAAAIKADAPSPQFPTGFTFSTPPYVLISANPGYVDTPAGAYFMTQSPSAVATQLNSLSVSPTGFFYPTLEVNGNITALQPVYISAKTGAITTGFGGAETITLNGSGESSISTQTASVSIAAVLTQLRSATNVDAALAIARNAGLAITGGATDEDGDVSYLIRTPGGVFVAATGDYDASSANGAPILDGYIYNEQGVGSDEFVCQVNIGNDTAGVNTSPDGKVYGLANVPNYAVSVECGQNDAVSCLATQAAANAAAAAVTAVGGPPVVSVGDSSNVVTISWINSVLNNNPNALADSIPIVGADGTDVCNIRLSTPELGEEYASQIIAGDPGYLQTVITHEIGHCMGLGHSTAMASVMYHIANPGTLFTSDDEGVLAALRSNQNIPVTCSSVKLLGWSCDDPQQILTQNATTNAYSCASCPAGEVPITDATGNASCQSCPSRNFYQQVESQNGNLTIQNKCNNYCSGVGLYNITGTQCVLSCGASQVPSANGYQCECAPGMTYDVDNNQCEQVPSEANGSLGCNSGFMSNGQCYPTASGTSDSNICFTLEDGSVQCTCANGYTQQGNSCVANAPAPTGGYDCTSDNTCVYNPNGGQFPDQASCEDACTD